MKTQHFFLLVIFFIASCSPIISAPTVVPTHTTTLPPIPTATQIPSQTPLPETWVSGPEANTGTELSKELFESIENQNPILSEDGDQILNADTGEVLLEMVEGEWEKAVKEYPQASLENYQECYVPVEDLFGDKAYFKWLEKTFHPELMLWFQEHEEVRRTDWRVQPVTDSLAAYDISYEVLKFSAPGEPPWFTVEGSTPWKRDVTFGYTVVEGNTYVLYPVFYYQDNQIYTTVYAARIYNEGQDERMNESYANMNQTATIASPDPFDQDVLAKRTWREQGGETAMQAKLDRFMEEDLSALDGLVLLNAMYGGSGAVYYR